MIADSWSKCPKCKELTEKTKADLIEKVVEGYGEIPVEKYDSLVKEASEVVDLEDTLREDYEFCLEGDNLNISYGCSCERCGFSYTYNKDVNVLAELLGL